MLVQSVLISTTTYELEYSVRFLQSPTNDNARDMCLSPFIQHTSLADCIRYTCIANLLLIYFNVYNSVKLQRDGSSGGHYLIVTSFWMILPFFYSTLKMQRDWT